MAAGSRGKGLKSVGSGKPLRSRGFLSQPGGQIRARSANSAEVTEDQNAHHRSRGGRQVSVSPDNKPQTLSVKPAIKPYTLEDE